tara:strand:+ start:151 stop:750 length:600 start_codon:yes stop_codon:yes gene_type:complete
MSEDALDKEKENSLIIFIKKNIKILISIIAILIIIILGLFFFDEHKKKQNILISEKFNKTIILLELKKIEDAKIELLEIIEKKHDFYSPLALNLLIDNKIERDENIILVFDKLINSGIDNEKKELIRIKKALFLMREDFKSYDKTVTKEELILRTLKPIINSSSIWKSSATKIMRDFYLISGEKNKAKEFEELLFKSNK